MFFSTIEINYFKELNTNITNRLHGVRFIVIKNLFKNLWNLGIFYEKPLSSSSLGVITPQRSFFKNYFEVGSFKICTT